jgi:hypothetical protein
VYPSSDPVYLSTCPVCQNQIDVSSLDPFTKLKCPFCGQMVRVRRKFDHFLIVRQIGEGGMSRVFEAEDETLGRRVALKILNQRYSRDATRVEQFRQEALITANVNHPNVIKLFSVGYDQGYFYIAMELVEGGSLEQRIRRDGRIDEEEALHIGVQVAEGLRAAQQMGLIHRDVKPANILFTETGTAKVVDFGLALFADRGDADSGEIWATPYYVAPEKILDHREDYRSDIFSLGATLYHALTGRPPHKADTDSIEQLRMIKCRRVALEDSGARFAPRTIHAINRMLAFRPQERCANYDETVDELRLAEGLLTQPAVVAGWWTNRKLRWGVAAVALLGATWLSLRVAQNRERSAVAVTQRGETSRQALTADEVTLRAGSQRRGTVAERFTEARSMMLEQGLFSQALNRFEQLLRDDLRQPTLNWTRINAAICQMHLGKRKEASLLLRQMMGTKVSGDSRLMDAPLAQFFSNLGAQFATEEAPSPSANALSYRSNDPSVMGYLLHGLANWHYGNPVLGASLLEHFSDQIHEDHWTQPPALNDSSWVKQYVRLVQRLQPLLGLAAGWTQPSIPTDEAGCAALLQDLEARMQRCTQAPNLRGTLQAWARPVRAKLEGLRLERERVQLAAEASRWPVELAQWRAALKTLPALADGYNHAQVVEMLRSMRFDAPDIQSALLAQRYLHEQSRRFMERLQADLAAAVGAKLSLRDRNGLTHAGLIVSIQQQSLTLSVDNATWPLPLHRLAPESLVETALRFAAQCRDSGEFYLRHEEIAAFARTHGMISLAGTLASNLMEENRGFRQRWSRLIH